uniref:Secreted protein n=1 Tax=Heterorhabditis bacteriophora TaxID=37862 RepID=A0A1I7XRR1_HETBA
MVKEQSMVVILVFYDSICLRKNGSSKTGALLVLISQSSKMHCSDGWRRVNVLKLTLWCIIVEHKLRINKNYDEI